MISTMGNMESLHKQIKCVNFASSHGISVHMHPLTNLESQHTVLHYNIMFSGRLKYSIKPLNLKILHPEYSAQLQTLITLKPF